MAIKQFIFSFKLDAKDLLEYVTERNVAVTIDAYGTPPKVPKQKQLSAPKTLALPPPTKRENGKRKRGAMDSLLIFLAMHKGETVSRNSLIELLVQQGYSKLTLNNAIWQLIRKGLVRSRGKGAYYVTPKGIRTVEEKANG